MTFDKLCNDNFMYFYKLSQMQFFIQGWKVKFLITQDFCRSFSKRTYLSAEGNVHISLLLVFPFSRTQIYSLYSWTCARHCAKHFRWSMNLIHLYKNSMHCWYVHCQFRGWTENQKMNYLFPTHTTGRINIWTSVCLTPKAQLIAFMKINWFDFQLEYFFLETTKWIKQ